MPITVGPIKFNLKDRGYKFFGNNRNFNIPLLVAHVNSEATQERVRGRNMFGYYGHWARVKYGHLTSTEGGIDTATGKAAIVEPALVTTSLKAYPDGTIEHTAEFLDTEAGRTAARLHQSRAGGFSAVTDSIKNLFLGLDYVLEPNFRINRGYVLDSAGMDTSGLTFDDACGFELSDIDSMIRDEQLHAIHVVLDSAERRDAHNMELLARLEAENEELLSMLAKRAPQSAATFDAAGFAGRTALVLDTAGALHMQKAAQNFASADLPQLDADSKAEKPAGLTLPGPLDRIRDGLLGTGNGATYG